MPKYLLFITPILLILSGCKQNSLDVDVSGIDVQPLEVKRFEQALFALDSSNFEVQSRQLQQNYGVFYEQYLRNPLHINGSKDTSHKRAVLSFINDKDVRESYLYTQKVYPDQKINDLAKEMELLLKRFRYHFPDKKLPSGLKTCVSGWNYWFSYVNGSFVLALDMYLGDTCKFYDMLRLPRYQTVKMNQHYILPDVARGWLLTEFDNDSVVNNLLSHTIFYGKLYYAVNALIPDAHDSLLIGYTGTQIKFCKGYEKKLWGYFAEQNRLYENSLQTVRELTSEGPFTGAISKDCPPRIAMWVGWQIVRSYMKNNEDVTLQQLMNENDAQKILTKSRYRP